MQPTLLFDEWRYLDLQKDKIIEDFKYTSAHELGHSILSAYGGKYFSITHDDSSKVSQVPNGKKGHGIKKEFWHCHIEAATKGEGYNNFYSLGKYRIKAEDFMKTKFDKDGNSIK